MDTVPQSAHAKIVAKIPRINTGAKTCAASLMRPHSRATLTAVSGLSPVIIRQARWADRSERIAGVVPGLSLFSKMTSPRKRRPLSACSLGGSQKHIVRVQGTWGDIPFHPLSFEPSQAVDALSRNGDNTIASSGVVREQVIVVLWDCSRHGEMQQNSSNRAPYKNPFHRSPP